MGIQLVEQDPALLGALKEACQNDYFHSKACSKMRGLEDTIGRVARTDSTVLIVGETSFPHNQYGRVCSGDTTNGVLKAPHFRARLAMEVVVLTRFLQRSQQCWILFN